VATEDELGLIVVVVIIILFLALDLVVGTVVVAVVLLRWGNGLDGLGWETIADRETSARTRGRSWTKAGSTSWWADRTEAGHGAALDCEERCQYIPGVVMCYGD